MRLFDFKNSKLSKKLTIEETMWCEFQPDTSKHLSTKSVHINRGSKIAIEWKNDKNRAKLQKKTKIELRSTFFIVKVGPTLITSTYLILGCPFCWDIFCDYSKITWSFRTSQKVLKQWKKFYKTSLTCILNPRPP